MAKLAVDLKMREHSITEAQLKCVMYRIQETETANESASAYSNIESLNQQQQLEMI